MARFIFDPATGEVVPAMQFYVQKYAATRPARSDLSAPHIIGDACEVVSQADGQTYTSKAALRASYRAKGVIEVGNDSSLYRDPTTRFDPENDGGAAMAADAALWDQHVRTP
jgi:hypothetical protein